MTTDQKIARRKLSLLDLAAELGNVSKACRVMGYSRQQFYEIRRNFETYGAEGLLERMLADGSIRDIYACYGSSIDHHRGRSILASTRWHKRSRCRDGRFYGTLCCRNLLPTWRQRRDLACR